jgi:alpha-beta hydrolase superfamily lysophospholipase
MVQPIERAGYGVVIYDYPYNRDVEESVVEFRRDWDRFRAANREKRPWALVSHSMGALLARELVEGEPDRSDEVASSIMIAPVNGGSYLAQAQTSSSSRECRR